MKIKKENLTQGIDIENAAKYDAEWDESIAGYMGVPYEFSCPENFESATLTFTYDVNADYRMKIDGPDNYDLTLSGLNPRIYYVNEKTGELEELKDQKVDPVNGIVTVEVTHFSEYVLLNKDGVDKAKDIAEDIVDSGRDKGKSKIAVSLIIDSSGSMNSDNKIETAKKVAKDFVKGLCENSDSKTTSSPVSIVDFGDIKLKLDSSLSNINSAIDEISTNHGTYIAASIDRALETLKDASGKTKYIVLLSDGNSGGYETEAQIKSAAEDAKEKGVKIFTIGLGSDVDREQLEDVIADITHGKYSYASTNSDLADAYEMTLSRVLDIDNDKDGLPDYCEEYGMYANLRYVTTNPKKLDTDNDGLKDGQEIKITYRSREGLPIFKLVSNPNKITGKKYNRDAAIEYAERWAYSHNPDYMALDTISFTTIYYVYYKTFTGLADCANFVSQCLYSGGTEKTRDWYYDYHTNKPNPSSEEISYIPTYIDKNGAITPRAIDYYFSPTWTVANEQYKYFANIDNGYAAEKPIVIKPGSNISKIIKDNDIQKGDLLYWSLDSGKTVHHATIISGISKNDILYAGHTSKAFDKSLSNAQKDNGETVIVVKLRDYLGLN